MKGKLFGSLKIATAIIVVAALVFSGLLLTAISKTTASSDNNVDTSKIKSMLEMNLEKFINYDVENEKGVLVELDVKTGIEYDREQEYKPLSKTGVLINAPKINGEFPESVEILPISSKATNGKEKAKDVECKYDLQKGEIKVITSNSEDENGNIYEEKVDGAKDNFKLILNYGKDCYSQFTADSEKRDLEVSGIVMSELHVDGEVKVKGELNTKFEVSNDISGLVNNKVTTDEIYNGYIKSNITSETKRKTEYKENFDIEISKKEIADEIKIEVTNDFEEGQNTYVSSDIDIENVLDILGEEGKLEILDEKGELIGEVDKATLEGMSEEDKTCQIVYPEKTTKIFVKLSKPEKIGIIKIVNNKQIEDTFTNLEVKSIKETSKITCSNIVEKAEETTNSATTMFNAESAEETTTEPEEETKEETKEIYAYTEGKDIDIKDSKAEVKFSMDNTEWTNERLNEVNFKLNLVTTEEAKHNLFKNPSFEIQLPSEVEKVNLDASEATLIYGNGLELKEENVTYNPDTKTIKVTLIGEQVEYLAASETEISILARVLLNSELESKEENVSLSYTNNDAQETGSLQTKVNVEDFRAQQVDNTEEETEEEETEEATKETVENNETEKENVSNTKENDKTEETTDNNTEENKQTTTEDEKEQESSNEDTKEETTSEENSQGTTNNKRILTTAQPTDDDIQITAQGLEMTVKATRGNVEVTTSKPEIYEGETIKYTIKVKNTTSNQLDNVMVRGMVPDGTVYAEYKEEFDKINKYSSYQYNEASERVDINVGTLKAGETKEVYYEVRVSDLAESDVANGKEIKTNIYGYIGENVAAIESKTQKVMDAQWSITAVATRRNEESFIIKFDIKQKREKNENEGDKSNYALLTALLDERFTIDSSVYRFYEYNPDIGAPDIDRTQYTENTPKEVVETQKENVWYVKEGLYILTVNFKESNDIKVNEDDVTDLISNFKLTGTENVTYRSNELITKFYYKNISFEITSPTEGENVKIDDEIIYNLSISNNSKIDFTKDYSPEEEKETNKKENCIKLKLEDYLPKKIDPVSVEYNNYEKVYYQYGEGEAKTLEKENTFEEKNYNQKIYRLHVEEENPSPNVYISNLLIPYGKTVNIKVKATAGYTDKKTQVDNLVTIYDSTSNEKIADSKTVSHIILPNENEKENDNQNGASEEEEEDDNGTDNANGQNGQNGQNEQDEENNPDEEDQTSEQNNSSNDINNNENNNGNDNSNNDANKKYTISGLAWKDNNEDGKRDTNEPLLTSLEVLLIDSKGNVINTVKTSSNGSYSFNDLAEGKYIVVFKYNATKYRVTQYQAKGVDEKANSDAIGSTREINGVSTNCGVTDLINLKSNISNIDIGLIENKKFNFKVDKYISKVTVKTSKGTTEHNFNNSKLAKVEIHSKEIEGATAVVEYKIVITNTGELAGKVGTITDTLPDGLKFSSELSKNWSKGTDGALKNNSIANKTIEPGNSVELTLVATKTMTANNTGTFTNKVQIGTLSNESKIQETDINDNTSSADLIISVSTGEIIMIVSIITAIIVLAVLLIVLKGKTNIFKKINIFVVIIAILLVCSSNLKVHAEWGFEGDGDHTLSDYGDDDDDPWADFDEDEWKAAIKADGGIYNGTSEHGDAFDVNTDSGMGKIPGVASDSAPKGTENGGSSSGIFTDYPKEEHNLGPIANGTITISWPASGGPAFSSGGFDCSNHGVIDNAVSVTKTLWYERKFKNIANFTESDEKNFNLVNGNAGQKIQMEEDATNLKLGPFVIKKEHDPSDRCDSFKFTVYGIEGEIDYSPTIIGPGNKSGTYYLIVPKNKFPKGVKRVTAYSKCQYDVDWDEVYYQRNYLTGGQPMEKNLGDVTYHYHATGTVDDMVEWTIDTFNIKVQKKDQYGKKPVDEYGNEISLEGINFILKGPSGWVKDSSGKIWSIKTDADGKTSETSIWGLQGKNYKVYEVIYGGGLDLPERLRDFYDEEMENVDIDGEKFKLKEATKSVSPSNGRIYVYTFKNTRDRVGLRLRKVDDRTPGSTTKDKLATVKFKIKDLESGKWVTWRKNPNYDKNKVDPATGKDDAMYIVDGLTDKYDIDDEFSTLTTGSNGYTERVKRFDIKNIKGEYKKYAIYEVDAGKYRYLYDVSDMVGGELYTDVKGETRYAKLVDTWEPRAKTNAIRNNNTDNTSYGDTSTKNNAIEYLTEHNTQTLGTMTIEKYEPITGTNLSGIGFKIQIKDSKAHNGQWVVAEKTKDINTGEDIYERTGFTKTFADATIFYTEANGKTLEIRGLPIYRDFIDAREYDPNKNYPKCNYDIYEVYIPTKEENPENLRLYFDLDMENYSKRYEAKTPMEALLVNNGVTIDAKTKKAVINTEYHAIVQEKEKDDNDKRKPKNITQSLPNKQAYLRVSGNVWEEVSTWDKNKNVSTINNKYDKGNDNDLNGIPVRIVDKNNGYEVVHTTVTGRKTVDGVAINGHYEFSHVIIDKLEDYLVQFTYDGVTYERTLTGDELNPVKAYTFAPIENATDYSRAKEIEADRDNLNDTFTEVNGENQLMPYKRKVVKSGHVVEETNNVNITYDKEDGYVLSNNVCRRDANGHAIVDNANHVVRFLNNIDNMGNYAYTTGFNAQGDYTIDSETEEVDKYYLTWVEKYRNSKELFKELPYLNLGLYLREQPDLSISKDLYKAKVSVNGKTYSYLYSKAKTKPSKNDINEPLKNADGELTTVGVQFEKTMQLNNASKYFCPIYRADVEKYDAVAGQKDRDFEIKVMYLIKVINDHPNLYTRINKLEDYYSADFANIDNSIKPKVYIGQTPMDSESYLNGEGTTQAAGVNVEVDKNQVDGKTHCTISNLNLTIDSKESGKPNARYIYIEFDVKKEKAKEILTHIANSEEYADFNNLVEISSYTTFRFDKNGNLTDKTYAGFDLDSIPNNNYIDKSYKEKRDPKLEDDVDGAPGLQIIEGTARTISGTVFEDEPLPAPNGKLMSELNNLERTGLDRLGNGIYDAGEKTIKDVTVTLVDLNRTSNSKSNGEILYQTKTDENGNFKIENFYASDYELVYEWGDGSTSRDGETYNGRRYKSTILNNNYVNKINALKYEKQTDNHGVEPDKLKLRSSWWYQEDTQEVPTTVTPERPLGNRYSEAVDIYDDYTKLKDYYGDGDIRAGRVSVDKASEVRFNDMTESATATVTSNTQAANMLSKTEKLSVEVDIVAKDNNYVQDESGFRKYYYEINNIDLGLIERPEQSLRVEKVLTHLKVVDGHDTVLAESDVEIGPDGSKRFTNQDIKYTVYLAAMLNNQYGRVKAELDVKDLDPKIIATYKIQVTNTSENDFYRNPTTGVMLRRDISDAKDAAGDYGTLGKLASYYVYGTDDSQNQHKDDLKVQLTPTGVFDYMTDTYDILKCTYEENNQGKSTGAEAKFETVEEQVYASSGKVIYANERTILEEGYERFKTEVTNGLVMKETREWKTPTEQIAERYEDWYGMEIRTKSIRKSKLQGKEIVDLEALEKPMAATEKNTVVMEIETPVPTNEEDLVFRNQAEITTVKRTSEFGRAPFETYTTLYDEGEEIIITPPTGENRDTTGQIIIIISSIVGIALLGVGIIIIKKKVLTSNK